MFNRLLDESFNFLSLKKDPVMKVDVVDVESEVCNLQKDLKVFGVLRNECMISAEHKEYCDDVICPLDPSFGHK